MSFLLRAVRRQIGSILSFVHRHGNSSQEEEEDDDRGSSSKINGNIGIADEDRNISGERNYNVNNNNDDDDDNKEEEKGDQDNVGVIAAISSLPNRDTELFDKLKELEYCYFGTLEQRHEDYNLWFRNNLERRDRFLRNSLVNERGRVYDKRTKGMKGGYWEDTIVFHCMHHGTQGQESTIVARKISTPQWWWWLHQQGGREGRNCPKKRTILRDSDIHRQIKYGQKHSYKLTPCQQCQKLKKLLDDKEAELLFLCHKFKLALIDGIKDEGSLSRRLLEDQGDFGISFRLKQRIADFVGVPYTYNDYGTERISEYKTIYLQSNLRSKVSRRVRLQGAI